MKRRIFGKTNKEVSILAFGVMRLPIVDDINHHIDEGPAGTGDGAGQGEAVQRMNTG